MSAARYAANAYLQHVTQVAFEVEQTIGVCLHP